MIKELWSMISTSGLGLYLIGLASLGGISTLGVLPGVDQHGTGVLAPYANPTKAWATQVARGEEIEQPGRVSTDAPWTVHLRRSDEALWQKDIRAARQAWHQAYLEALGKSSWEGMLDVGHAYLRIGEVTRDSEPAKAKARSLYLTALFRARSQGTLDGVLRAGEAFAALGDREVANQTLRIAEGLAAQGHDPYAPARVRSVSERLTTRFVAEKTALSDSF